MSAAIASIGFYAASVCNKRVRLLECCIKLIRFISADIGYCGESVFVILKKAATCREFSELDFLHKLIDCENSDFSHSWADHLSLFERKSALNSSDIALLKSFGDKLGTTDCLHQTQLCNEYIQRFEERYEYEKSKLSERLRLYRVSGVAGGLAMLILLL